MLTKSKFFALAATVILSAPALSHAHDFCTVTQKDKNLSKQGTCRELRHSSDRYEFPEIKHLERLYSKHMSVLDPIFTAPHIEMDDMKVRVFVQQDQGDVVNAYGLFVVAPTSLPSDHFGAQRSIFRSPMQLETVTSVSFSDDTITIKGIYADEMSSNFDKYPVDLEIKLSHVNPKQFQWTARYGEKIADK